ncbi:MAG: hypothetical protein EP332_08835 [Bacteroidetes bacterium]|nr:MAG: hypothetical protein EP332_08835 [Bacteroidota bacterium]
MLVYYLLIWPFSRLPLFILYGLSYVVYFVLRSVLGYRKQVINANIKRVFPEFTDKQVKDLRHRNYRHLSYLVAEGIRNLGIGKKELKRRMHLENPELFERLYAEGKSVMLISSHFENWEFFITAQSLLMPHQAMGIGKKIKKAYLNTKINGLRERFGMEVIHNRNYRERIEAAMAQSPVAVLTLSDQSPAPDHAYWTKFFGVDTPFAYGPEFMAHLFDMTVVYLDIQLVKRGHYKAVPTLLFSDVKGLKHGEIMEALIAKQEEQICRRPEAWLWSHKRWKLNKPADFASLRAEQKARFDSKFGR